MSWVRAPYIKPKGFCPNPIVKFGIPKYADSVLNPKCVGTPDHNKYWTEQLHYILNGYDTGGMFIPGRYYYYLNFTTFQTVYGRINPLINDTHLEVVNAIDYIEKHGKNLFIPKKRRGGLSEIIKITAIDYDWRFKIGAKVGIASGQESYVQDFMEKWDDHNRHIVPELRLKMLRDNADERISGWKEKNANGFQTMGTGNAIYMRTMFKNPNLFKGLYLNKILAEEIGEFEMVEPFFEASKHCMMFGSKQIGNFIGIGTGNQMNKGTAAFKEMCYNPSLYNAEVLFISAPRFCFPNFGGAHENGNLVENVPNLQHLTEDERIGVDDIEAGKKHWKDYLEQCLKEGNIEKYIEEKQNNPFEMDDVFNVIKSSLFDHNILNETETKILSEAPKYTKYILKRKTNENGEFITPLQVELIPAKDSDKEEDCVLIADDGHYIDGSTKLFCAGIDSYDFDQAKTSKSLGAMCVLIRDNDIHGKPKNKVVAVIRCRPERKEMFYDRCLLLSAYYNLNKSVLIDDAKTAIIEHFKKYNGTKYLAQRPLKFQSSKTELITADFGFHIDKASKPQMLSVGQSYVKSHGRNIVFLDLIRELRIYNESTDDSDNDLADAFLIAVVQDNQMGSKPLSAEQIKDRNDRFNLSKNVWESQSVINHINPTQDNSNFGH